MKYSIGIDLGGTNIAAGVVDENNVIVGRANVKTALPRPAESIADSIKEVALMALVDASVLMSDV
ncbi:MAG: ROK family protein, partial [Clostridia bacterium]|nr:ROK family protein [Clostridia bacterium]